MKSQPNTVTTKVGKPGPFPVIEAEGKGEVESPVDAPRRRYECSHYEECLALAAALNWDNFTCRGCCGNMNMSLVWQAHQAARKDGIAQRLCDIPEITCHCDPNSSDSPNDDDEKHVA